MEMEIILKNSMIQKLLIFYFFFLFFFLEPVVSVCCSKEPIRGNEMRLAVSPVVNHGCEAGRHGK